MIFPYLLSFTFVSSGLASFHNHHTFTKRGPNNPDPVVAGNSVDGWQGFPDIPDATTFPEWVINADLGASIPAYQTSGLNTSAVKRAIIILPGKPRDCWYYWNVMNNALYTAADADPGIKREEVSIFGPCFFTQLDKDAGAVASKAMVFGDTTWASGQKNSGPDFVENFSSYQVLDALVSYYMDRKTYPNLNVVMLAGHSAGAQMAQRYIALRQSTTDDDRLHFWIANPGSLLWLTEDRPVAVADCEKTDLFKYGLAGGFPAYASADAAKLGRDGLVSRYTYRNAHYAWGLDDSGPGDTRCEAMTQGSTHLERGQNFQAMLEGMNGGVPEHTTIDFIQGVSHDNVGMMASGPGIDKLFRYDYNGTTVTYTATSTDNGTSTTASTSASQVVILSQLTISFALLLGQFFLY